MEALVLRLNYYVANIAQFLAIVVITIGMLQALWTYIVNIIFKKNSRTAIKESRLELGLAFSLGLGFLIGSSILKTVVAPTWDDIGKLSSIILIRTLLNFFLIKDINEHKITTDERGERFFTKKLKSLLFFHKKNP